MIELRGLTVLGLSMASALALYFMDRRALYGDEYESKDWVEVDLDEVIRMIRQNCIQLIDVRERSEVYTTGMIPKAVNIPLSEFEEAFKKPASQFVQDYGVRKPSPKDMNIITYCLAGKRSRRAIQILHENGWIYARSYAGSWSEYSTKDVTI